VHSILFAAIRLASLYSNACREQFMNVLDAIQQRRAVKHFDAAHVMPAEIEQQFLNAARLAPTSFNIQHWRFVLVKDPSLRQQVRQAAWNQAQITDASLLIVLCADVQAWQKQPERYWQELPDVATRELMVNMLQDFYRGREWLQRDEAMRSVGLAAQTLMLTAQELGYAACPMIGFDAEAVGQLIRLPADHVVGMIVTIGKATQAAYPRSGSLPYAEVVFDNQFPAS